MAEQLLLQFPDPDQAEEEEWRMIAAFPVYAVSSAGPIKRVIGAKMGRKPGRALTSVLRNGYPYVTFCIAGKETFKAVHVIVCETFHGPRPSGHQVAHRDGNRQNAAASNLRWATPKENAADKLNHGTHNRGSRHPGAMLVEDDVIEIKRLLNDKIPKAHIARKYGVHIMTIMNIYKERSWAWLSDAQIPGKPN